MTPPIQARFMDELQACQFGSAWLEGVTQHFRAAMADSPVPVHFEMKQEAFPGGGGVMSFWVNGKPKAWGVLQRDSANFTIITLWEHPA